MSKAKKIIICFLGACLVACSGITAFAYSNDYSKGGGVIRSNIARPDVVEGFSYIEVWLGALEDINEFKGYIRIYVFNPRPEITPIVRTQNNGIYIYPLEAETSSLTVYESDIIHGGSWNRIDNNYGYLFSPSWGKVRHCRTYGEIINATSYTQGDYDTFYGSDNSINQQITTIISLISENNKNTDKITSNADKNANNIQSNNDKNTQSIIDNQNQLVEQEKTETQNSGNNSVSDVSGSVPDKSAGMLSALQSLSNAVSYTGTSAKWTFPQMYIPSISGVTDRINLNSEMEIDFTYWVNQIPQDIRTVITALATIGLVIFAFKELYGLISYVLTLKGGGNNE